MSLIKIEFPADRADIALAFSVALQQVATGTAGAHVGIAQRLTSGVDAGVTGEDYVETASDELKLHKHTGHVSVGVTGPVTDTAAAFQAPANNGVATRVDLKGVPFDPNYCAVAQEPFYASGATKGQWKKKKGVADDAYANWYSQQLVLVAPTAASEETDPTPQVNTAGAFGATQQPPVQQHQATGPKTAGELMQWTAEQQTAKRLTQEVITNVYSALGIRVTDLFAPTPEAVIAQNVQSLYVNLMPIAAAAGA